MIGAAAVASWRDLELAAPEIARRGMARLTSARVALLGTLRRDGSPRISPIEPYLAEGQLLIGAMAWTAKAADAQWQLIAACLPEHCRGGRGRPPVKPLRQIVNAIL